MLLTILLVILIFGSLVFIHELGHFVAARRNGVEVEEFGFGFPPRVYGKKVGRTIYSINALPLGGFVRMKGEDQADSSPGTFNAASYWAKTKILLAGVTMNLIAAYVLLVGLCLTGLPPILPNQVSVGQATVADPQQVMAVGIAKGSPAAKAGIVQGDIIAKVDGREISTQQQLLDFTKQNAGKQVSLDVERDGATRSMDVQLRGPDSKEGYLGVTPFETSAVRYNLIDSLATSGAILGQLSWATVAAFGGLINGLLVHAEVSDQVAGPVGITVILSNIVNLGIAYVLVFVVSISVSLAVVNSMPLPALDGGRFVLVTVNKLLRRPISAQAEGMIHLAGFVALIALMVVVTFVDISRLR